MSAQASCTTSIMVSSNQVAKVKRILAACTIQFIIVNQHCSFCSALLLFPKSLTFISFLDDSQVAEIPVALHYLPIPPTSRALGQCHAALSILRDIAAD